MKGNGSYDNYVVEIVKIRATPKYLYKQWLRDGGDLPRPLATLAIHLFKAVIVLVAHLVRQEFHRIHRTHLHKIRRNTFWTGCIDQQLFFSCVGFGDIDRREDTLIRKFQVSTTLLLSFKFFKDHFIHARTGFDQAFIMVKTALLYIARSPEKAFGAARHSYHPPVGLARRAQRCYRPVPDGLSIQQNHTSRRVLLSRSPYR